MHTPITYYPADPAARWPFGLIRGWVTVCSQLMRTFLFGKSPLLPARCRPTGIMPGNIATLFNLDSGLFGTYGFLSGSPITARSLTLWKQKVNWRKKHRALAMAALRRTAVQHPK